MPQANHQLGDGSLRLLQRAPGLGQVEFRDRAALEARLDDRQRLALDCHVLLGVLDPLLGDAHLRVGRRHLAQEGDQHVVIVLDRGVQAGGVRFDRPPEPAPEIEFPAQVEPQVPLTVPPLESWESNARQATGWEAKLQNVVGRVLAEPVPLEVPGRRLRLRQQVPSVDGELRPGLKHAHPRHAQRQVLPVGAADQGVEHRVVEDGPPFAQVVRVRSHALVRGVDPVTGHRGVRLAVVGADLESVLNIFLEGGTPAERSRQAHQPGEVKGKGFQDPSDAFFGSTNVGEPGRVSAGRCRPGAAARLVHRRVQRAGSHRATSRGVTAGTTDLIGISCAN